MESLNNAERTLIHISHLHPLKLTSSPEPRPMCHACKMSCNDQSYGCTDCWYFLHVTCATTSRTMDHPLHPAHKLKFELTPPYLDGTFRCDACGIAGTSFCLRCRECCYDLHLPCAAIPHQVKHPSHHHPLFLVYKNPYPANSGPYNCDLCKCYLDVDKWFYLCRGCNFGGHVGCLSLHRPEVLSPGLQAHAPAPAPAPPPPMAQQPQPHGATRAANDQRALRHLQSQLQLNSYMMSANAMSKIGM